MTEEEKRTVERPSGDAFRPPLRKGGGIGDGPITCRAGEMGFARAPVEKIPERDLEMINRQSQTKLGPEDVNVRSMWLCSDRFVESDGLRFSHSALENIANQTPGISAMVGHNRTGLPIGRFYHAEIQTRGEEFPNEITGQPAEWVRAWFYWLRDTEGAEDLLKRIDGGIYRDVSISWRWKTASCSICGEEWDGWWFYPCEHVPGERYPIKREDGSVEQRLCYFEISEVTRVLEGSLVYAGADQGAELAGMRVQASEVGITSAEAVGFIQLLHENNISIPGFARVLYRRKHQQPLTDQDHVTIERLQNLISDPSGGQTASVPPSHSPRSAGGGLEGDDGSGNGQAVHLAEMEIEIERERCAILDLPLTPALSPNGRGRSADERDPVR